MANVLVKVCGITNAPDARLAANLGAAMLGFNFYPNSPRYIAPERAAEIIAALPAHVEPVGVFVNTTTREIGEIAARTRIRAVQLHGDETASDCADVRAMTGITVIKALRIAPDFHPDSALPYPADWLLVDAHGEEFGGSGRTADWQVASAVAAIVPRVMLAGGLKADNVALAIRTVRPCAVDVASGVEFAPGRKDAARLRAFFSAVAHAAKGEMD